MWSKLAKISIKTLFISIILSLVFANFVGIANAESLQITNVEVSLHNERVTISWHTNMSADGRVDFGLSSSYDAYIIHQGNTLNHELTLNNLRSDKVYHFKITSRTADGEELSTFDRTFTTADFPQDNNNLEIKNFRVAYTTGTSITFQWYTAEPSTSIVYYGKTTAYGKKVEDRDKVNNHDITIGGLDVSARYNFKIQSVDKDGNVFSYHNESFKTTLTDEAERIALTVSNFSPITANDPGIADTSVLLSWTTSRLAGGDIYYGTDPNRLRNRIRLDDAQVFRAIDNQYRVGGLEPNTTYYFMIRAQDVFGVKKDSEIYSVHTKVASESSSSGSSTSSVKKYSKPESLLQVRDAGQVITYAVYNGQKYGIPSVDTFNRYNFSWNDVKRVAKEAVQGLKDIRLIKTADSHKVYQIINGKKIHLPGPAAFNSYSENSWADIVTLDTVDVNSFPTANLVKTANSPKVYLIKDGYKKEILSESAFESRGYKWGDIITITQTHLDGYSTGLPIK